MRRDTEIAADLFALQTLPPEDFEVVVSAVQRILFNDTALSHGENFDRNLYLRENAKNILSGRHTVLAPPTLNRSPPFIIVLVVACFLMGLIGTPDARLTALIMLGASVLMAAVILILIAGAKMQTAEFSRPLKPKITQSAVGADAVEGARARA